MAVGDNIDHGSRVTKIAQSDNWAAAQRVMVIAGIPALGFIGALMLTKTINNGETVAAHTITLENIDRNMQQIGGQVAVDHDKIGVIDGVILVINSKLEQLPLLWSAISRGRNPAPADKPQP